MLGVAWGGDAWGCVGLRGVGLRGVAWRGVAWGGVGEAWWRGRTRVARFAEREGDVLVFDHVLDLPLHRQHEQRHKVHEQNRPEDLGSK